MPLLHGCEEGAGSEVFWRIIKIAKSYPDFQYQGKTTCKVPRMPLMSCSKHM